MLSRVKAFPNVATGASIDHADAAGVTALILAAANDNEDALKVLIAAGAALDLQDAAGMTALSRGALAGHTGTVKALLDAGELVWFSI